MWTISLVWKLCDTDSRGHARGLMIHLRDIDAFLDEEHEELHGHCCTLQDTGLYVGFILEFPGAHSQARTLEELNLNLQEVVGMLLEDGEPVLEAEFVGTQHSVVV